MKDSESKRTLWSVRLLSESDIGIKHVKILSKSALLLISQGLILSPAITGQVSRAEVMQPVIYAHNAGLDMVRSISPLFSAQYAETGHG
jgi:hypothetical protein